MLRTPAPEPAEDELEPDDVRAEQHIRMLQELGEMAMALSRALHGQALAAAEVATEAPAAVERAGQATTAFNRAARTVRQTVALESRMRRELAAMRAAEAGPPQPLIEGRTREDWIEAERRMRGAAAGRGAGRPGAGDRRRDPRGRA